MQHTSKFKLNQCGKKCRLLEDRISAIPDDILVSILSLLTMQEAARTSVLSHRWRYLWKLISSLNFDDSSWLINSMNFDDLSWRCKSRRKANMRKFVDWVNQVSESHKGQTLDAFIVRFDVDEKNHKHDLDSWFEFAVQRKVKRLELSLLRPYMFCTRPNYTVMTQFLRNFSLDSLTNLLLNTVNLTGEVLDHILYHFPLLEVLSITNAISLVHAKVSGSSHKLKCLEIVDCFHLEKLDILASNLISPFGFMDCSQEFPLGLFLTLLRQVLEGIMLFL